MHGAVKKALRQKVESAWRCGRVVHAVSLCHSIKVAFSPRVSPPLDAQYGGTPGRRCHARTLTCHVARIDRDSSAARILQQSTEDDERLFATHSMHIY
jgi:hypothetical protein